LAIGEKYYSEVSVVQNYADMKV